MHDNKGSIGKRSRNPLLNDQCLVFVLTQNYFNHTQHLTCWADTITGCHTVQIFYLVEYKKLKVLVNHLSPNNNVTEQTHTHRLSQPLRHTLLGDSKWLYKKTNKKKRHLRDPLLLAIGPQGHHEDATVVGVISCPSTLPVSHSGMEKSLGLITGLHPNTPPSSQLWEYLSHTWQPPYWSVIRRRLVAADPLSVPWSYTGEHCISFLPASSDKFNRSPAFPSLSFTHTHTPPTHTMHLD